MYLHIYIYIHTQQLKREKKKSWFRMPCRFGIDKMESHQITIIYYLSK